MKKLLARIAMFAMVLSPFLGGLSVGATTIPNWDVTGNYVVNFNYQSADYAHDMTLAQNNLGNLTGNGGYPAGGAHTYAWTVTSGTVVNDTVDLYANYTASEDAVTPLTVMHMNGTIAPDGSMSGTWSDNYQGGDRTGTWSTTSGAAIVLPGTVRVIIDKFIDGQMATSESAGGHSFPMSAKWSAVNIGTGNGTYSIGPVGFNSENPYEAITADMTSGANYGTFEMTDGEVVGKTCDEGHPFMLVGYTSGDTLIAAKSATPSMNPIVLMGLTHDKYVIVWNHDCSKPEGAIGGNVIGGVDVGVLAVTSITATQTTATADNTFAHGWKYTFNITVPTSEQNLAMKFDNWFSSVASSTIPVANNTQISSGQADNGGAPVMITAANTFSSPSLHMTGDLDPVMPGMQVQVLVEVKIPVGSVNGSYTTNYGVQTLP